MGDSHAVTLDLWRTLVVEDPLLRTRDGADRNEKRMRGVIDALASAGHNIDRRALEAAFARVRTDMDHAHHNGVDRMFPLWIRQVVEYAAPGLFDRLDDRTSDAVLRAVDDAFLDHPPRTHEAAGKVLAELSRRNVKLGLISNTAFTSADTYRKWFSELGWLEHFGATTFSNEAGMAKPAAEIFRVTLQQLATPPERALHVGDSHHSDIEGAHAAGLWTAWVSGFDHSDPNSAPDYTLGDLSELPEIVDTWLARRSSIASPGDGPTPGGA